MRSRCKVWSRAFAIGVSTAALALQAVVAMAETKILSGTVTFRERIALPTSAKIEVKLVDVSRADAPSKTIAQTSKMIGGSMVPIAYELGFDPAEIQTGRSYALQARIVVDGELWFTTTTRHPIFSGSADRPDILVQRVGFPQTSTPASPTGRWLAEDIGGGGVIDRLQTVLEIADDGSITGSGGCNRMTGRAIITQSSIAFGPIASTNMSCTPAAMHQEQKFFAALSRARSWRVHSATRKLALLDADGQPVVTFAWM